MAKDKSYLGDTSKYDDIIKGLEKEVASATGKKAPSEFSKAAAKLRELNKKPEESNDTSYVANTEAIQAYLKSKEEKTSKEPEYKINQEAMEKYAKEKDLKVVAKKVYEKLGVVSYTITKNNKKLATIESQIKDIKGKGSVSPERKALITLSNSLSTIASSLKRVNMSLNSLSKIKVTPEVAAPISAPAVAATAKPEEGQQKGFFDLLKDFFTNPAVLAALAGIVYTVLPKEFQDKLKGFFSGFSSGLEKAMGDEESGLKGLTKSIKIAGYGIATIFGLKFISSIASAITTAINLVKLLGGNAAKLGRLGKAGGKLLGKMGPAGAIAAVGGAAVGAAALMSGGEEEKDLEPKKQEATTKPSVAASKSNLEPSGGTAPPGGSAEAMTTPAAVASKPSPSGTGSPYGAQVQGVGETGSASEAMAFFQAKGWTKEQAAGIVGNLQAESGANMKTDSVGDGGKAYGIAQWHPDRQAKFQQVYGKPIQQAGFKEQLEFVNWELNNNEKRAGDVLRATKTPEEAAAAVDKYYERSSGQHLKNRIANALALTGGKAAEQEKMTTPSSTAVPAPVVASNGAKIDQASKGVKQASEPSPKMEVSTLNNSTQTGVDKSVKTPSHDIPSPIANRGSLEYYTKHSTFYI